jgi:hypothetical protein
MPNSRPLAPSDPGQRSVPLSIFVTVSVEVLKEVWERKVTSQELKKIVAVARAKLYVPFLFFLNGLLGAARKPSPWPLYITRSSSRCCPVASL